MPDESKHEPLRFPLHDSDLERFNPAFQVLKGPWKTEDTVVRKVLVFIAIAVPIEQQRTKQTIQAMFPQHGASVLECLEEIKKLNQKPIR
jgi:hypothetical protein